MSNAVNNDNNHEYNHHQYNSDCILTVILFHHYHLSLVVKQSFICLTYTISIHLSEIRHAVYADMNHNRTTTTVNCYANVVNMCAHYGSLLTTANDNALPFLIITYYQCTVYTVYTACSLHCIVYTKCELAVSIIHHI